MAVPCQVSHSWLNIVIFSAAQLFADGIIGEYLARMHFRTMDRPTYPVSEIVSCDGADGRC